MSTPWHVVHAPSVQKANEILSDPEFKELLARQKKINQWFRGGDSWVASPEHLCTCRCRPVTRRGDAPL